MEFLALEGLGHNDDAKDDLLINDYGKSKAIRLRLIMRGLFEQTELAAKEKCSFV